MKYLTLFLLLPLLVSLSSRAIEGIMENMKKPKEEIIELLANNDLKNAKFKANVSKLLTQARSLASRRHKDKEFNEYSKDNLNKLTDLYKAIVKKEKVEVLTEKWDLVYESCHNCHDSYD